MLKLSLVVLLLPSVARAACWVTWNCGTSQGCATVYGGRATGRNEPASVSAGGTYAKKIPRSIVYGMWFPGKPYPGHDVDEKVAIADLHLGAHALIEALADLACGEPIKDAFKP